MIGRIDIFCSYTIQNYGTNYEYVLEVTWEKIILIAYETVFLISEFSLRYLLIFEDQTLVLDFSSRYQKENSQMHF